MSGTPPQSKRRTRAYVACQNCRRRKMKANPPSQFVFNRTNCSLFSATPTTQSTSPVRGAFTKVFCANTLPSQMGSKLPRRIPRAHIHRALPLHPHMLGSGFTPRPQTTHRPIQSIPTPRLSLRTRRGGIALLSFRIQLPTINTGIDKVILGPVRPLLGPRSPTYTFHR
jgi:hypothetical protein